MEIRSYVVEQHFGSELVDIEVEIGFMETRPKTNKMKEKRSQTEHPLKSYIFCQTGGEAN